MKNIFALMAGLCAFAALPAFADHHGDMHGKMMDGKHPFGLEKLDANGDGSVSKDEFMAAHEEKFTEMDTNGDGVISKEELEARRAQWKEKMEERHEHSKGMRGERGAVDSEEESEGEE